MMEKDGPVEGRVLGMFVHAMTLDRITCTLHIFCLNFFLQVGRRTDLSAEVSKRL